MTLLETQRLILSGWTLDQVDDLVRLHSNSSISRYLTLSGEPWTEAQARKAVEHWIELFVTRRLGKMRLTRKSDGLFVGRAGFGIYARTGEPELGFALLEEHQGQGYATEAAIALRDWIFRETDAPRFLGFADTRNAPSLSVLAKVGMTKTHIETEPNGLLCQFHVYERPHND